MKKSKRGNRIPNWQMIAMGIMMLIVFSGLTMAVASERDWTVKQMIIHYFIPSFIGCSLFAIAMGSIMIVFESKRKQIVRKR